jgi:methylmalonyl-CoA mutase
MTQANPAPGAPSLDTWRAQVEKELGGASFEKALVHTTAEGLAIQPLYVDGPAPVAVPRASGTFGVIMRHDAALGPVDAGIADDLAGGADGVWLAGDPAALGSEVRTGTIVLESEGGDPAAALTALAGRAPRLLLGADPIGAVAAGRATAIDLAGLAPLTKRALDARGVIAGLVSTLPYHRAGADAADELAIALSAGAAYLGALVEADIDVATAAAQIAVQVAVGRDTFLELAKLRALRIVWAKLTTAAGATTAGGAPLLVHAVSSPRTLTERDPWVNMLRVTTQVFAAVLGGADLVTPAAFDEALGAPSPLGRRTARNTALVLREESHLGRVVDPAAGSYYLESVTDALAREAWKRFQALERDGGVAAALTSGALAARLDAAWKKRAGAIGKRKDAITGVSEFANLDEARLPRTPLGAAGGLPRHRDAEPFEALRNRVDALGVRAPDVLLLTLGPPAEHRGRVGYATAFFATAGLRVREGAVPEKAAIAVLCGSDERYATEAADAARSLKSAGVGTVLLAGRPGALEAALREAGVDGFVFVGCDVAATLNELIGGAP